jgi:hypothetical protein
VFSVAVAVIPVDAFGRAGVPHVDVHIHVPVHNHGVVLDHHRYGAFLDDGVLHDHGNRHGQLNEHRNLLHEDGRFGGYHNWGWGRLDHYWLGLNAPRHWLNDGRGGDHDRHLNGRLHRHLLVDRRHATACKHRNNCQEHHLRSHRFTS